MRDKRKLNRVREAALLIQRAVECGWKRSVLLQVGTPGHTAGPVVFVRLTCKQRHGCHGRIDLHFTREWSGARLVVVRSRVTLPSRPERPGLQKAWNLLRGMGGAL